MHDRLPLQPFSLYSQPATYNGKPALTAANRLASRPEHLATQAVDPQSLNAAKIIDQSQMHKLTIYENPRWETMQRSPFTHLNTVYLNPQNTQTGLQPVLISAYYRWFLPEKSQNEQDKHHFVRCFTEHSSKPSALLNFGIRRSGYPRNNEISAYIYAIESNKIAGISYRQGSLLMQLAIEWSLRLGHEGRVTLSTIKNSQTFYIKLGFLPCDADAQARLDNNKSIQGENLYLPAESIAVWKEKISRNPIMLTQDEVRSFCMKTKTDNHSPRIALTESGA